MDTDSTYDSDPSMDLMVIDSGSSDSSSDLMVIDIDSDDSSIQIIEPPPPEIIDLVSDDTDFLELLGLDTPLPELTPTHSDTIPAPTIPEPVPEREEPTIPEILSQFEPTPYPTLMTSPDLWIVTSLRPLYQLLLWIHLYLHLYPLLLCRLLSLLYHPSLFLSMHL